jgi:hypothetical protein
MTRRARPSPPSEAQIQRQILKYLEDAKIPAWRSNSGVGKMGGRFIRFGIPGQADITGLLPLVGGRRLEVEVKTTAELHYDRNPAQLEFQAMIQAGGGLYIRTDSLEDFQAQLRAATGRRHGRPILDIEPDDLLNLEAGP